MTEKYQELLDGFREIMIAMPQGALRSLTPLFHEELNDRDFMMDIPADTIHILNSPLDIPVRSQLTHADDISHLDDMIHMVNEIRVATYSRGKETQKGKTKVLYTDFLAPLYPDNPDLQTAEFLERFRDKFSMCQTAMRIDPKADDELQSLIALYMELAVRYIINTPRAKAILIDKLVNTIFIGYRSNPIIDLAEKICPHPQWIRLAFRSAKDTPNFSNMASILWEEMNTAYDVLCTKKTPYLSETSLKHVFPVAVMLLLYADTVTATPSLGVTSAPYESFMQAVDTFEPGLATRALTVINERTPSVTDLWVDRYIEDFYKKDLMPICTGGVTNIAYPAYHTEKYVNHLYNQSNKTPLCKLFVNLEQQLKNYKITVKHSGSIVVHMAPLVLYVLLIRSLMEQFPDYEVKIKYILFGK